MPMAVEHTIVSMQESTIGAIVQFMDREGCECLQSNKLLAFLAGALQHYEEEGVVLHPRVILCNQVDEFCQVLPGGRFLVVGQTSLNNDAGKQILKQCANLARAGWTIFVERNSAGTEARFGVLSFLASPTSIELREMVTIGNDTANEHHAFIVLVEQYDPKTILFSGSRGHTLKIAFSTTRANKDDSVELINFSRICCSNIGSAEFTSFFSTLLRKCLNESHGTILICTTKSSINDIKGMSGAVVLEPSLNIKDAFNTYKTLKDADSILELQRSEALLTGMLQCDGIVVFDNNAVVKAYRVLFHKVQTTTTANDGAVSGLVVKGPTPAGGARRKAYEDLKPLIGGDLLAAFFRSQDGATEFTGV